MADEIRIVIGLRPASLREAMHAPCRIPFPGEITFPVLASEKIDGVRNLAFPGFGCRSRTGCRWRAPIHDHLAELLAAVDGSGLVTDGELYLPGLSPRELQDRLGRRDADLDGLQYLLFDAIDYGEYEGESVTPYALRHQALRSVFEKLPHVAILEQRPVETWEDLCGLYRQVRRRGGEGLMIRDPAGLYRHGRCTMAERNLFKVKPLHPNSKQAEVPSGLEV